MRCVHADTFPPLILESLACGTLVVVTAVDGILEQIEDGIIGYLTPPGDADVMGAKAAEDARRRLDLERMADEHLGWYEKIISKTSF